MTMVSDGGNRTEQNNGGVGKAALTFTRGASNRIEARRSSTATLLPPPKRRRGKMEMTMMYVNED